MRLEPALYGLGLVGGIVVYDQMQVETFVYGRCSRNYTIRPSRDGYG